MKVLSFTWQGFRSFDAAQVFDAAALLPGLYHVTGQNLVNPELEGNAAGKSSFFEALCWLLYERTSKGLRAGNVKNWHTDTPCMAVGEFETPAGRLGVMRSWKPNALEVCLNDGEPLPVDQQELERLLGMGPDAFLASVYFAQFTPAFVDMLPAQQTELFTSVLQLGVWERAATAAGKLADHHEVQAQQLRERLAHLKGQAEELLATDHDAAAVAWDKDHQKRGAAAQKDLAAAEATRKAAETACQARQAGASSFRQARDVVDTQARACAVLGADLTRLEKELANLRRKDLTHCPTCGQAITDKHIKAEIARAEKAVATKRTERNTAGDEHDRLLRAMAKHTDAEVAFGAAEKLVATRAASQQIATTMLERIRDETNPHAAAAKAAAARAERLVQEFDAAMLEMVRHDQRQAAHQYWVKGFKELRLSLIRESLAQLTVEANECLFQLGLPDWAVEFDVESETKTGTIRKNFSVFVRAPGVTDAVPLAVWSGGESQRLRISVSMGFANLVAARAGLAPNLELWDEPTQWLPKGGIQALLQVLADRAQRLGKVILLADHRAFEFGGFSGTVEVVKDKDGSRLTVSV